MLCKFLSHERSREQGKIPKGVVCAGTPGWEEMCASTGCWVPTGSHQHGILAGALVLKDSVFFHRHLSETAQCNDGVEHRTGVGGREWRQEER